MIDPAGKLCIHLDPGGTRITSTRPVGAAGLLVGPDLGTAVRLLPSLFSICACAQAAAGVTAIEQGLGLAADPAVATRRRQLVAAETLREHLWRILLDWPGFVGVPAQAPAMAQAMAAFGALREALTAGSDPFVPGAAGESAATPAADGAQDAMADLCARQVFGLAPGAWLAQVDGLAALRTWASRTDTAAARLMHRVMDAGWGGRGRSAVTALPDLKAADLERNLAGADPVVAAFVARPTWDGAPRETSPLTRQAARPLIRDLMARFGNGLLPRLAAQLAEVADCLGATAGATGARPADATTATPGPGVGLAQVPAARGLLVHRVRISGGNIADYRILAPTEWNFHPHGVVAAGLTGLVADTAPADRDALARLFIAALDPCVDYDLVCDHSHP